MGIFKVGLMALFASVVLASPFISDPESQFDTESREVAVEDKAVGGGGDGSEPGRLSWPRWPYDFVWSNAGPVTGKRCLQINEPVDPHTWNDNYFCTVQGPGWIHTQFMWSYAGPITGMRCTLINEPADPDAWNDNYLCVPYCSPYHFKWSNAGPLAGYDCIRWIEPTDIAAWQNNYLCM